MKKIVGFMLISLFSVAVIAQKNDSDKEKNEKKVIVPDVVKKAFATQFPKVAKVKWGIEKPGEYEAEFDLNKTEMSVVYDEQGTLLETETEIKESDLPQALKSILAKDFNGYKIKEYEKNEAKGIVTYELEAKKDKKEFELVFDSNGKFIKQVEETVKKD